MSLATVQQLLVDKVRTLALGNDLASPLVQERAIAQALLQYSMDAPLQTYEDVANVSGGLFDVPPGWVAELSTLVAVEYPIGLAPMATLEAATVRNEAGDWQIMLLDDSLTLATVRVHYGKPHTLTTSASTVPARHENALACWAAAELCRQLATQKGHERDATISAVSSNGASQSGDLARRAKDWFAQYRIALGLPDPEAATGGNAAGTVVSFERTRTRARFHSLGH